MLPSPHPASWSLPDPRIGWGISLFLAAIATFVGFGVAMRAQGRGEPMSKWSRALLVITSVLFCAGSLLLAFGFDVFGRAARAYTSLPAARQGLLLGICVTVGTESVLLLTWAVYVRGKRRRQRVNVAKPPPVFNLDIILVDENDKISFWVQNLGDPVKLQAIIHPLSGVEGWPAGRTLAAWEDDAAEQVVSIDRGDRRRLVVGRREGNGRYSDRRERDDRADSYIFLLLG